MVRQTERATVPPASEALLHSLAHDLREPIRSIRKRLREANSDDNAPYVNERLNTLERYMVKIAESIKSFRTASKKTPVTFDEIQRFVDEDIWRPIRTFNARLRASSMLPAEDTTPQYVTSMNVANTHGRRFARRVDSILNYARVQGALRVTRFGVHNEVKRVIRDMEELVETTSASVDQSGVAYVLADQIKLALAVQNLIENAIKYRRPGVEPRIEVRISTQESPTGEPALPAGMAAAPTRIELAQSLYWMLLEVQDNGRGVAAAERTKVFEMFFRSPETYAAGDEGSGLGLSIVSEIVQAHSGVVGLDSQPGAGSTFWFAIPQATDPTAASASGDEVTQEGPGSSNGR